MQHATPGPTLDLFVTGSAFAVKVIERSRKFDKYLTDFVYKDAGRTTEAGKTRLKNWAKQNSVSIVVRQMPMFAAFEHGMENSTEYVVIPEMPTRKEKN